MIRVEDICEIGECCTKNSNPAVVETLIGYGADVKVKDEYDQTVLDYTKKNLKIYKTDVYWHLNDLMYK